MRTSARAAITNCRLEIYRFGPVHVIILIVPNINLL